ncbi:MAG: lamin tail domain-containing protein [Chitinophagaceae bacterium]|nr:lamin tail domain-containing protein [Chitinophagaceae bacterium]MBL0055455.1 lamin tail domain-containing protein [Chitinophagaceae bacterium]
MKQISTLVLVCLLWYAHAFSQPANRYDIIIDELMADPSPQQGLPNVEWIELRNNSGSAINLAGWRIGDASSLSGPMPAYILQPDSVLLVCTASAVAVLSAYGPVVPVTSFPSLDNTGDLIYLRSPQNKTIHAVGYSDQWYQNELKKEGGWTLEMIDVKNPCTGAGNWKAGTDASGGTPGRPNSVKATNPDIDAPVLLRAFAIDSLNIRLIFSETLDSGKAATAGNYTLSDGIGTPVSAQSMAPLFDQVNLRLNTPLQRNRIFTVTANAQSDCAGNLIGDRKVVRVGLSELALGSDIVINEVLFNPRSGGSDYVEVYNRSKKLLDLKNIYLANRNTTGQVANIYPLAPDHVLFFPSEYKLLSTDLANVKKEYFAADPEALLELPTLPSYNDDEGIVIVLNDQGLVIDELAYSSAWHFKLIDNPEGVSLERIDPSAPTQQPDNWYSAAGSVGYGTPGTRNSQYRMGEELKGEVKVTPEIVSPDNDGTDDFATIEYNFPSPGYVANIIVFDANGVPVRYLQRNALCGISGNYRWDGLGEKNQKLPIGIYIFYTEIFNLNGKKKRFKNVIVLARRS